MEVQYQIPFVPQDLRHEETIVQIAQTLDHLSKIVDSVVMAIDKRIDENKERIKNAMLRADDARRKVENLTKTKKATVVFSCTKYPASTSYKNYKSVFCGLEPIREMNRSNVKIKTKLPKITNQVLSEKLQFFHVKVTNRNKFNVQSEGLGPIPDKINSISSFLVFNSSKNPYQKYVHVNPLIISTKSMEKNIVDNESIHMDAAPISITSRDAVEKCEGENYFYSPRIGEVPIIDVPIDLPDLPGVADDLRYSLESGPAIAPSITSTPSIPDLPIVVSPVYPEKPVEENLIVELKSVPPPPLPPPLPPMNELESLNSEKEVEIKNSRNLTEIEQKSIKENTVYKSNTETQQKTENKIPLQIKARANLMEEIRKAGGSGKMKLRATSQNDEKNQCKASNKSGNFMDDLHAKLSLRRKGISGAKKEQSQDISIGNMDAMSRISAMIPPPPVEPDKNDINTTDEGEWD